MIYHTKGKKDVKKRASGNRINLERAEEIADRKVATLAVACPFFLTMLEDGMKELNKEEEIRTQDIAELVANNMA